jgi:hypothetical protein
MRRTALPQRKLRLVTDCNYSLAITHCGELREALMRAVSAYVYQAYHRQLTFQIHSMPRQEGRLAF